MADIVGAFCSSHAPGITGFPERAEPAAVARIHGAFHQVRQRLADLDLDALVLVSVEHFTNFFMSNLPSFAIGTASRYRGPVSEEMSGFLKVPVRIHSGAAELGQHLFEHALEAEFDPALVEGGFDFDENFAVPLHLLDPEARYPVVPIIVNGVNPPWPSLRRCLAFGRMVRSGIQSWGGGERVAVLATGGLSHWVGMPQSGQINTAFDTEFLAMFERAEVDELCALSRAQLDEAGNGAHEIRTWLVAAGAAGAPFDTLAYEPIPPWLTGIAVSAARI